MNMLTKNLLLIAALSIAQTSVAATKSQVFHNDNETNAIYLWINDINEASLSSIQLQRDASNWDVFVDTGAELFVTGNAIDAGAGRFKVKFDYQTTPFGFEWAEVLWTNNSYNIQDSGSLFWDGRWSATNAFSHASDILNPNALPNVVNPVPIPNSILLLGSALLGLTVYRRKQIPQTI